MRRTQDLVAGLEQSNSNRPRPTKAQQLRSEMLVDNLAQEFQFTAEQMHNLLDRLELTEQQQALLSGESLATLQRQGITVFLWGAW